MTKIKYSKVPDELVLKIAREVRLFPAVLSPEMVVAGKVDRKFEEDDLYGVYSFSEVYDAVLKEVTQKEPPMSTHTLDNLKELFLSIKGTPTEDTSLAFNIRRDENGMYVEIFAGDHDRFMVRGKRGKKLAKALVDLVPEGIKEVMPMPDIE